MRTHMRGNVHMYHSFYKINTCGRCLVISIMCSCLLCFPYNYLSFMQLLFDILF